MIETRWKAALKFTYIPLERLKKYKLDMAKNILSLIVSVKNIKPLKTPEIPLKNLSKTQLRLREIP
jgi:hypothetical protein